MRRTRFITLAVISFITISATTIFTPGAWLNRLFSIMLCSVISVNTLVCPANIALSTQRTLAASPPVTEISLPTGSSMELAQRSTQKGEFCNVQDSSGKWWLLIAKDLSSDPCGTLLTQHCQDNSCQIVSNGTYLLYGQNQASVTCQEYNNTFVGVGAQPLGQAFTNSTSPLRSSCTFQVIPAFPSSLNTTLFRNDNTNQPPVQFGTDIFSNPTPPNSTPSGTGIDIFSNPGNQQPTSQPQQNPPNRIPNNVQQIGIKTVTFGTPSITNISSDTVELSQSSPEGCKYTIVIKRKGDLVYQDLVKFTSPNVNICGAPSFTTKFDSDGTRSELQIEGSSGMLIVQKLSDELIRGVYKDGDKEIDLGKIPVNPNASFRYKSGPELSFNQDNQINQIFGIGNSDQQKSTLLKQDTTKVATEAFCKAGRRTAAGLATMFTVGAVLGIGLALATPVTTAIAGGTALTVGAYATTAAIVGWGSYFMFGGNPPILGDLLGKIPGVGHAYNFADGVQNLLGLASESELADRRGVSQPGVREPGKGGFDQIAAKARDWLTEKTGIPFNICDKKPDTQIANQPSSTTSSQPKGPLRQGKSYGDPHIVTFDGYRYSFQTVGEFVLVQTKDGGFRVQVRQGAVPGRQLSLNTGVAMQVGNSRVAVYSKDFPDGNANTPVWVDGRPVNLEGSLELSGGGSIQGGNGNYLVQWPTGEQVGISKLSVAGMEFMNVTPAVPEQAGRYRGLLGNLDNNPEDDLQTRDGRVIPSKDNSTYGILKQALGNIGPIPLPLSQIENAFFEQLYREFGDSWRISQAESLFAYGPGQSTESFTNRGFPSSFSTLGSLLPPQLRQAEEICRQAGVPGDLLEGCIFDVGNTGEGGFAQAALNTVLDEVKNRVEAEIRNRIPIPVPIPLPF